MIFASDLDNTIIFSKNRVEPSDEMICVDYKGDEEISFMMRDGYERMIELLPCLVPVTARLKRQYDRLEFLRDQKFAIISNGGNILKDGEIYKPYREYLGIQKSEFEKVEEYIRSHPYFSKYIAEEPKIEDNSILIVKLNGSDCVHRDYYNENVKDYIERKFDFYGFIEKNLMFLQPKRYDKRTALEYLLNVMLQDAYQFVVTAGDSVGDWNFVQRGDAMFIPRNSSLYNFCKSYENLPINNLYFLPEGIHGTKIMLDLILRWLV